MLSCSKLRKISYLVAKDKILISFDLAIGFATLITLIRVANKGITASLRTRGGSVPLHGCQPWRANFCCWGHHHRAWQRGRGLVEGRAQGLGRSLPQQLCAGRRPLSLCCTGGIFFHWFFFLCVGSSFFHRLFFLCVVPFFVGYFFFV